MPQINNLQSYSLENPQGLNSKSSVVTQYVNHSKKRSRSKDMANPYSLHMEHYALQQRRSQLDATGSKISEPWRNSLNILRTIPKPVEQELLRRAREGVGRGTKSSPKFEEKETTKGNKGKNIIKIATGSDTKQKTVNKSKDASAKSFKEIMDPYVSTEKRYEQYLRELETDEEFDQTDLPNALHIKKTENGFKELLSKENSLKQKENDSDNSDHIIIPSIDSEFVVKPPSKSYSQSGKHTTADIIGVVASANEPHHTNGRTSHVSHSKGPSRVGRVSSLGLDGRMSVTGSVVNETKKESVSRISMNSTAYTNYDGRGYMYRDGEISRKVAMPTKSENSSSAMKGVEKDVKLMEYLMKNSKVIPVYDKNKTHKKVLRPVPKKEEDIVDARGGGWKVLNGKTNRQPDFERMIPVSVVKLSYEIQTQTENFDI